MEESPSHCVLSFRPPPPTPEKKEKKRPVTRAYICTELGLVQDLPEFDAELDPSLSQVTGLL